MERLLVGKTALVTGGASGIGKAAALTFAREGAAVAVVDLDGPGAEAVAAEIAAGGGRAVGLQADVMSEPATAAMVAETVARLGGLDCAFNNAGHQGKRTMVGDASEEEWEMMLNLNLNAVRRCMKHQISVMLERGGGVIVNTSSGQGLAASPRMAAYTTTKHAVLGLTKSAAVDYGPHNIRVNALLPGATLTPMLEQSAAAGGRELDEIAAAIPLRRLGTAQDQAEAVVWLCSERAAFVTGAALVVDGGQTAKR